MASAGQLKDGGAGETSGKPALEQPPTFLLEYLQKLLPLQLNLDPNQVRDTLFKNREVGEKPRDFCYTVDNPNFNTLYVGKYVLTKSEQQSSANC